MTGHRRIHSLPIGIQQQIDAEYGSVQELYQKIFILNDAKYNLTMQKSSKLKLVQDALWDIEDKLETFGVDDGADITNEIAVDHGYFLAGNQIAALNKYLQSVGTDYATMQKWLNDNYGI